MTGDTAERPRRIAVVAVHGVANQEPSDTARSIAGLLQNLIQNSVPLYTPFHESTLRLNVRPVRMANPSQSMDKADLEFTRQALEHYEGEPAGDTFETVRLEGKRIDGGETVHVFEMYWADLSRLGTGIARILGEFYQLLFHVTRLGVHTARTAADCEKKRAWTFYSWLVSVCSIALTWPLAVFNLLLGIVGVAIYAMIGINKVPYEGRSWVAGAVLAVLFAGAFAAVAIRRTTLQALWFFTGFVASAGILIAVGLGLNDYAANALAAALSLAATAALALVIKAYQRRRPGVGALGYPAVVLFGAWLAWIMAAGPGDPIELARACLDPLALVRDLIRLSWAMLLGALVACQLWGIFAVRWRSQRAARAVFTCSVTLALPVALFLIFNIAVYEALAAVTSKLLPDSFHITSLPTDPIFSRLSYWLSGPPGIAQPAPESWTFYEFVTRWLVASHINQLLAVLLMFIALIVAAALWSIGPVAWTERFPPRAADPHRDQRSAALGQWLNRAFAFLRTPGWLLIVVVNLLPLLIPLSRLIPMDAVSTIVTTLGALLTGSALTIVGFRGRLTGLVLGIRPVLDVLLDVDNHLKLDPRDSTPRARIFARFVTLLRFIWTQHYDAVIVIAHSQGTVITADLFRFLMVRGDAELPDFGALDKKPVYLFTMGSPLRQLYGLRFPHLYYWTRPDTLRGCGESGEGDLNGLPPNPDALGVKLWVNAFRSGDYVGRELWRAQNCSYNYLFPELVDERGPWPRDLAKRRNVSTGDRRREFCIGPGAHTHYWDGTAPAIAGELDSLIKDAR